MRDQLYRPNPQVSYRSNGVPRLISPRSATAMRAAAALVEPARDAADACCLHVDAASLSAGAPHRLNAVVEMIRHLEIPDIF